MTEKKLKKRTIIWIVIRKIRKSSTYRYSIRIIWTLVIAVLAGVFMYRYTEPKKFSEKEIEIYTEFCSSVFYEGLNNTDVNIDEMLGDFKNDEINIISRSEIHVSTGWQGGRRIFIVSVNDNGIIDTRQKYEKCNSIASALCVSMLVGALVFLVYGLFSKRINLIKDYIKK